MIDKEGNIRCAQCSKKLGMHLRGYIEIPCPRCKQFNIFDTNRLPGDYSSHKLLDLTDAK